MQNPLLLQPRKVRLVPRLKLALLLAVLVIYPGQNALQKINLRPSPSPAVRGFSVALSPKNIPYWNGVEAPQLTAKAALVFDPVSGTILFEKESDTPLPPASTTKIMTALVALEADTPETILTVIDGAPVDGSKIKLVPGEQISADNLLAAMLIASANDAAVALARNYPGGEAAFIARMNQKANELNLVKTKFANVSGIEGPEHMSTVHDLVILTKEAFKSEYFRDLVGTRTATISDVSGTHQYKLESTNLLLGQVEGVAGVKTGWTGEAGECLVTFVERNGQPLFIAVLGSADRFGETKALIDWSYVAHTWREF